MICRVSSSYSTDKSLIVSEVLIVNGDNGRAKKDDLKIIYIYVYQITLFMCTELYDTSSYDSRSNVFLQSVN